MKMHVCRSTQVNQPIARAGNRRTKWSYAVAAAALLAGSGAFAQSYYDLTVTNNFGPGEYYGANVQTSDIWLLSNFQFDYKSGSSYVTGNSSAGTYGTAVQLSTITDGALRLYAADGGTRMYAVLSPGGVAPTSSSLNTSPNNYFEWSFSGGNPGTLDLSWIDSWDFSTQMKVQANGTLSPAPTTVTYGGKTGVSSATVASKIASYASQSRYAWLGTSNGGFSQDMSYPGATNPVRWITKNSAAPGNIDASTITSFTEALDSVITKSSTAPAWVSGSPATGPNWTSAGFRMASTQQITSPDGTTSGNMWSAYVNFSKDNHNNYTMTLTDFTVYGGTPSPTASYSVVWNSVTNAGGATYSISQDEGMLNGIWTSSPNALTTTPAWVADLGSNGPNLWYALYNAVASGVVFTPNFVNNAQLPTWAGYVPWVAGQDNYNFEILTAGAQIAGGRAGNLTGTDLVAWMEQQAADGTLVNPYFLELLKASEQTPAYLFPSQDFWGSTSIGSDTFIGMQTGPLNGGDVFGNATLEWSLGTAGAVPEPSSMVLLGLGGLALAGWAMRRRNAAQS
jgi:hypothetical protein